MIVFLSVLEAKLVTLPNEISNPIITTDYNGVPVEVPAQR